MKLHYCIKLSLYLLLIPSFLICAQQEYSLAEKKDSKPFHTTDPLLQIQEGDFEEIELHSEQKNIQDLQRKTGTLEGTSFQIKRRNKKTFYSAFFVWIKKHFSLCNAYPLSPEENDFFMEMASIADLAQEESLLSENDPYYQKSLHADEIF